MRLRQDDYGGYKCRSLQPGRRAKLQAADDPIGEDPRLVGIAVGSVSALDLAQHSVAVRADARGHALVGRRRPSGNPGTVDPEGAVVDPARGRLRATGDGEDDEEKQ